MGIEMWSALVQGQSWRGSWQRTEMPKWIPKLRWNKLNRQALYFFYCFLIYVYVYICMYISYIFIWFGGLLSESTWKHWLVCKKKIKRCFIAIHSNASSLILSLLLASTIGRKGLKPSSHQSATTLPFWGSQNNTWLSRCFMETDEILNESNADKSQRCPYSFGNLQSARCMKDVSMVSTSALALAPCFTMSQACRFNREPVDRMIGQLGNVPDCFG